MFSLSFNFKTAGVLLHEKFVFDNKKTLSLLNALKANSIAECVYLPPATDVSYMVLVTCIRR